MNANRRLGQGGFTLIEIIAVLVILGILMVVAIPKYLDMQKTAAASSLTGGLAAVSSQASIDYAAAVLANPSVASGWTAGKAVSVGDFVGSYSVAAGGAATASITGGASKAGSDNFTLGSGVSSTYTTRLFTVYQ